MLLVVEGAEMSIGVGGEMQSAVEEEKLSEAVLVLEDGELERKY